MVWRGGINGISNEPPHMLSVIQRVLLAHPTSLLAPISIHTCTYNLHLICSHVPAECKSIISYYKMMQQPFISFSVYQSIFTVSCTALALTWCRALSVCGKQNYLLIILWHCKNLVNHIPFVTHITFWNLKSMLKLVQMYSVLILQCRKNVLCLAPCCLIQWNLHFTFLDSTHVLIGSTTASIGMWNFPWMYNWSSYPVPWIYAQIEHEQTCCSHFKFSQLGIRKKYAYLSYMCLSL